MPVDNLWISRPVSTECGKPEEVVDNFLFTVHLSYQKKPYFSRVFRGNVLKRKCNLSTGGLRCGKRLSTISCGLFKTQAQVIPIYRGTIRHFSAKRCIIVSEKSEVAAVHAEHLPGDKGRSSRKQEGHRAGDVPRRAQTAQRRFIRQLLLRLLVVLLHHPGVNDARGHAVDAHAAGAQLLGQRAGEAEHAMLRRGIGGR